MLAREEETETDVRREDQLKINEFGKNNARLAEIEQDLANFKQKLDVYDDASTDLMMGDGEDVLVMIGDSFVQCSEEFSTQHIEALVEKTNTQVKELSSEATVLEDRQAVLKKSLYGRFGASINLEA